MSWRLWLTMLAGISAGLCDDLSVAAETQRIGIPAGYYEVPAHGKLRIVGYCLDRNLNAPNVGEKLYPLKTQEDMQVTREGAAPLTLGQATTAKVLSFQTHELTLNEFLDMTEANMTEGLTKNPALRGSTFVTMTYDRPGADSDTGRIRAKFGDLPLTESLAEIRRSRIHAGASPKSYNDLIDHTAQEPWVADGKVVQTKLRVEPSPPVISLGATLVNHTDAPLVVELKSPLILATDKRRGVQNIDMSQIKPADDFRERKRIQDRVWENNETLAAAHCRNYQEYLSRFNSRKHARGRPVQDLVHQGGATLVLISTADGPEIRRVQNDVQETIARGEEVTKAFQGSSRRSPGKLSGHP